MRRYLRALSLGFLSLALVATTRAQEITATIAGTVTDQSGAPLPGVAVVARNLGKGVTTQAVSSNTGRYTLPYLINGEYEITFTLSGFKTYVAKNISLHVNDRLEVGASLRVEGVTESVEVTASGQLIQPSPAVQNLMGSTQVQELPLNNRNFVQLATLVPGVSSSLSDEVGIGLTSTVSLSINGARRNAVNWLVDGAQNVDVGSNITLLSTPTLESIEEFKIITSSYSAEWPRSGGGIINVVTKSGSNTFRGAAYEYTFRGAAYEYNRSDSRNANSFFRKQSTDPAIRDNPASLKYNNYGATLGGPLIKDELFFFGSFEQRKINRAPSSLVALTVDPAWLTDPNNANYVAPALRDPNAVKLLSAWPAPNTGTTQFQSNAPNKQDTTQWVGRMDWHMSAKWRAMVRYTHDLSNTVEPGGLFFGTAIPNVATTVTDVPGQIFVGQIVTTINPHMVNEVSLQYTSNAIKSVYGDNAKNKRDQYGINIPELYPENRNNLIPSVNVTGLAGIGAPQLFDNNYKNYTLGDSLSYTRGNHSFKGGLLLTFEQKNEWSGQSTQGTFNFVTAGGRTAFQNFLTGNADGLCGASCTYTEPEKEVQVQERFNRYEFYVQDSWHLKPNVTIDLGVRYALYPGVTDVNNLLTNFVPSRFDPTKAGTFSPGAGTMVAGTGDVLNGIVTAGQNSPYGTAIYPTDKGNIQPRVGFSWDLAGKGETVVRGGYGIYYDQPLVGIFEQNAFVNPPLVTNPQVLNPKLSNPGSGASPATRPIVALTASSDPFQTPRTQQWNVGVQRKLYARGVIDVGYVGSAGDNLIQPIDINAPTPKEVMATNGVINLARPYAGYAGISYRQTTAKARYNGLLVNFRHDAGRKGLLSIAYTLSKSKTDATNDRDAVDLPQDRTNLAAEYAISRTDRTHVFTANYVYELPFFRDAKGGIGKQVLGGWQLSGITEFWSGPPISRVVNGQTNGSRRGIRVNQISDPFSNLPANTAGGIYYFNPAAFAPPADGQLGTTGRAIFRLPGVNQWDITASKNWYPSKTTRLQFRADFINAFNHTQLDPAAIQNVCTVVVAATDCSSSTANFGKITGTRAPREIQLGIKFFFN